MDLTEEEIREAYKQYVRRYARERLHNNPELRKKQSVRSWAWQKAQMLKDPEKWKQQKHEYDHRPEVVSRNRRNGVTKYHERRQIFFDILGSECKTCGFKDKRALQIDHLHNDGAVQRKKYGGSLNEYRHYLKHQDEIPIQFQILCANCNWIKRADLEQSKRDVFRCEFPPRSDKSQGIKGKD